VQWPELGAKLAAVQAVGMAREAAAAAATPKGPSAASIGAKGPAGSGSLGKGKLLNGERKPKKISLSEPLRRTRML
jgi:hypothetical protein